ncbi:daunorubicin resistance protein DrrA family ABC transporter ATP-binding protein [Actinoplanes cyaneus]|uniref:Daunorubicin resistance protein DrrA family ABC transporter ATP-binding protein n=1 Tax=Actinoplanes cyaneus TaxID=52696 RepID=A0A919INK7_9ACTN|nr:ATP-binding cassette domain-containing protein [Actinoplanes cyaneus]MCW2141612.1 ABC-2 type transport system ATP-binding protein [Actinoplanes cyaneus]GID68311.1 daunorubicin resistance protein DrrA family ABC transporter ATP-binding protein [Actinoplanes cyaneus]
MTDAVTAEDLRKTYPGGVRALDGLTLTVRAGEVFGLLGPNGAGKSSTVKILTTLARPDSGRATVAGHDVLRHPDRVRREIGVVPQRSALDPAASGRDNLTLQARIFGVRGRRRVDELLERFDLAGAANRAVRGWSGGMQRRLDVALALVHKPGVLFLDEPTTGLDPEGRAQMWTEIGRLAADESIAILLTTHYLDEADRLAARLAIVDGGRIVAEGTPAQLKGELRGDAVHLELRQPPDEPQARQAISHVAGLRDVALDGRTLSARADDGAAAVPAALAALESAGIRVATVTVARPSLDDVYLRHAGRRFAS